jgi:hypothetical protein
MQQIAEKMGCNRGTVSKWLAKDTIKAQSNELDRLISDAQAKYDSLPPSEAERLRDLRDTLRSSSRSSSSARSSYWRACRARL